LGAGAIGAITKTAAKGGIFATLAVALAAGNVGGNLGTKIAEAIPGTKANRAKNSQSILKNPSFLPKSPSPSDILSGRFSATSTPSIGGTDALSAFLAALAKNTAAIKKNTKTQQDLITDEAVRQNLAKQKALSGSTALAVGQGGKLYMPKSGVNVVVNNAGSVISGNDLVTSIVNGIERTTRRSFGTVGAFDIL
jgi:hypothetical protein